MLKWAWLRIKIGAIPFVILGIPIAAAIYILGFFDHWGIHLFKIYWADVPLSISLVLLACFLVGLVLLRPRFQEMVKEFFPAVPIIGPILIHFLVPNEDLKLLEVMTYDGNWEYAICLRDKWIEGGKTWYRVHTLGFGSGKLFSRVDRKNIRIISDKKQRDAWISVLSMGLLSGENKEK